MQEPTAALDPPRNPSLDDLDAACLRWVEAADPSRLSAWIARELDPDGCPTRLAIGDWAAALDRIDRAEAGRSSGWAEGWSQARAGLFRWLVHASRADGSALTTPPGRDRARVRLLTAMARAGDPAHASVVSRWFPDRMDASTVAPPLPAIAAERSALAILRPDWSPTGDWVAVDARGRPRVEVAGDGRPWIGPDWPAEGATPARRSSWSTGPYADAFEWTFKSGPTRVTRTAVLLRYRKVALLAQQEDGPATGFRVSPFEGTAVAPLPGPALGLILTRGRKSARVVPIGGSASHDAGMIAVTGPEGGRRRWLGMAVAWGKAPTSWRPLTVTERSTTCPAEVASGTLISWGVGQEGLLIYRSLAPPDLRVVLGHQTRARFLVGRFNAEGNVVPLLSLD